MSKSISWRRVVARVAASLCAKTIPAIALAAMLAITLPALHGQAHPHEEGVVFHEHRPHTPWDNYLFVPNRDSDDIAVIDATTDTLIARIEVGSTPHQVALSPESGKLAVTNSADDTLSIIDLREMQVTTTLALGKEPEHMQLHPAGELLAVGNIKGGSVSLVSLSEERELHRIAGLHEPHNLTFSPEGDLLYVGNLGANFVSVIDLESASLVERLPVGEGRATASLSAGEEHQGIIDMTPNKSGDLGFAAFGDGDALGVFDLRSGEELASLPTGDMPWRAYPSADDAYMLVPNNGDRSVSIFETKAPFRELARVPGTEDMTGVNSSETTAFVIGRGGEEIVMLDLENFERIGVISLPGASPETGIITPDGKKFYVALSDADAVAVIDVEEREMVGRIENVGASPWGAFMLGADNYCH